MSKSMLIVNTPDSCLNCPFSHTGNNNYCGITNIALDKIFGVSTHCPMKELNNDSIIGEDENKIIYKVSLDK